MEEEKTQLQTQEAPDENQEKVKSMWQIQKESWYDKIPLNLKQLDKIVAVCWILIVLVIIIIALDALDIFNPFGY